MDLVKRGDSICLNDAWQNSKAALYMKTALGYTELSL